jgi:uncharacterized protein (DUF433 family)
VVAADRRRPYVVTVPAVRHPSLAGQEGLAAMTIVLVGPGTKHDDGWLYRRYLIEGTRLEPYMVADLVRFGGETLESCSYEFGVTVEQVKEAVEFCEKRTAAAKRGWERRRNGQPG